MDSSRTTRIRDAALAAALLAVVVVDAGANLPSIAVGAALTVTVVLTGRRRPAWSLLAGTAGTLAYAVGAGGAEFWPAVVCAVAAHLAGRRMGDAVPALACFTAVAVAGLGVGAASGDVWSWVGVLATLVVAGVLPWLVGRYARQRAALAEAGWQRAAQLEREHRLVREEARLRERARIARDMHDSLGHDLALIAMRAGALELDSTLDDGHRSAVAELRVASADATERLREIIGVLRDEAEDAPVTPVRESIVDLVARTRASGLDVTLVRDGEPPPEVERAAYRVVQEALTNAARHAPGAAVDVRVAAGEAGTVVTVTNAAAGRAAVPSPGGGRGLIGLRERVRLAGGTLRAGPSGDGGYAVEARLPHDGTPAQEPGPAADDGWAGRVAAARRTERRGLVAALVLTLAGLAVAAAVLFAFRVDEVRRSYLDPVAYDALRVGGERVDADLPPEQVDGRPDVAEPPVPAGSRCDYYRLTDDLFAGPIDVARLCFAGGRLVEKAIVAADGDGR